MEKLNKILNNKKINTLIKHSDLALEKIGFTEHSYAHCKLVSDRCGYILTETGNLNLVELAMISGYMHDIGNVINRVDHSQSGAILAYDILKEENFDFDDICEIIKAIGNHDEGTGKPVSLISSALIIADKSDVRRSRVRLLTKEEIYEDIHDRVNYAVKNNDLKINKETKEIILSIEIDTTICSIIEYFEIFAQRMKLCEKCAKEFGYNFKLKFIE